MVVCTKGDFTEDFVVMVTTEEEGVSSCVEPVLITGLQNIINESAQAYCSAHGVEKRTSMRNVQSCLST